MIGLLINCDKGCASEVKKTMVYDHVTEEPTTAMIIAMRAKLPYKVVVRYLDLLRSERLVAVTQVEVKDERFRRRMIYKYRLQPKTIDIQQLLKG